MSDFDHPAAPDPLATPAAPDPLGTPAAPDPLATPAAPDPLATPAAPDPLATPAAPDPLATPAAPDPLATPATLPDFTLIVTIDKDMVSTLNEAKYKLCVGVPTEANKEKTSRLVSDVGGREYLTACSHNFRKHLIIS